MAKWICAGAAKHDVNAVATSLSPTSPPLGLPAKSLGPQFEQLLSELKDLNRVGWLPAENVAALSKASVALGV